MLIVMNPGKAACCINTHGLLAGDDTERTDGKHGIDREDFCLVVDCCARPVFNDSATTIRDLK
jgi:hypothetical protein